MADACVGLMTHIFPESDRKARLLTPIGKINSKCHTAAGSFDGRAPMEADS